MKKTVVLTSIQAPTAAIRLFAGLKNWEVLVVGDARTPRDWHCPGVQFISAAQQKSMSCKIARLLPWNHYARKMLGYLLAARDGAELLAESDDDNFPEVNWTFPAFTGSYEHITGSREVVNVYSLFSNQSIWPRGFPLSRITAGDSVIDPSVLKNRHAHIGVWQALVDDDPDVDAIYRLTSNRPCLFARRAPVVLPQGTFSPFNSQNTAFRRELLALMYLPALVNFRVTDILRGYVAQPIMWAAGYRLGFSGPNAHQERNPHDLHADFISELPLYMNAERILPLAREGMRPEASISDNLYHVYRQLAGEGIVPEAELDLLSAWLDDVAALGQL